MFGAGSSCGGHKVKVVWTNSTRRNGLSCRSGSTPRVFAPFRRSSLEISGRRKESGGELDCGRQLPRIEGRQQQTLRSNESFVKHGQSRLTSRSDDGRLQAQGRYPDIVEGAGHSSEGTSSEDIQRRKRALQVQVQDPSMGRMRSGGLVPMTGTSTFVLSGRAGTSTTTDRKFTSTLSAGPATRGDVNRADFDRAGLPSNRPHRHGRLAPKNHAEKLAERRYRRIVAARSVSDPKSRT